MTFVAFASGCAVTAFACAIRCFYQKKLPSTAEWIPKYFKFSTVLHNYDRAIEETQTRAMMNVVICICFLIITLFIFDRSAPLLKEWFIAKHMNNESSWRSILRGIVVATPVVNEAMIIVSLMLTTLVFTAVVAMLHFTGCSKYMQATCVRIFYDLMLCIFGDATENDFRRSIHMKMHELETHVYETLGNANELSEAECQTRWENVRHRALEHRNALQVTCDERASAIAANSAYAIKDGVSNALRSAVMSERRYVQNSVKMIKSHIL